MSISRPPSGAMLGGTRENNIRPPTVSELEHAARWRLNELTCLWSDCFLKFPCRTMLQRHLRKHCQEQPRDPEIDRVRCGWLGCHALEKVFLTTNELAQHVEDHHITHLFVLCPVADCTQLIRMKNLQSHTVLRHPGISIEDLAPSIQPHPLSPPPIPPLSLSTMPTYTFLAPAPIRTPSLLLHKPVLVQTSGGTTPSKTESPSLWGFIERDPTSPSGDPEQGTGTPNLGSASDMPGSQQAELEVEQLYVQQMLQSYTPSPLFSISTLGPSTSTFPFTGIQLSGVDPAMISASVVDFIHPTDVPWSAPVIGYPSNLSTHQLHHPPRQYGYYINPELKSHQIKNFLDHPSQSHLSRSHSTSIQKRVRGESNVYMERLANLLGSDIDSDDDLGYPPLSPFHRPSPLHAIQPSPISPTSRTARKGANKRPQLHQSPPSSSQ